MRNDISKGFVNKVNKIVKKKNDNEWDNKRV